jgi:hypothetical protein
MALILLIHTILEAPCGYPDTSLPQYDQSLTATPRSTIVPETEYQSAIHLNRILSGM